MAQMRPAGGFPELTAAIGVRLQDAAAALQVLPDMFALSVGGEAINGSRRRVSDP